MSGIIPRAFAWLSGRNHSLNLALTLILSCTLNLSLNLAPSPLPALNLARRLAVAFPSSIRLTPIPCFLGSLLLGAVIMIGSFAVAEEASRPAEEDAKLGAVFQDYLKELFRREPLTATRLGEHAFDDQLDDLSAEARKATLEFKQKLHEKLGLEIAVDKLSPDGRIDYEIFRKHLEREVWLAENSRPFEDDPRIYG